MKNSRDSFAYRCLQIIKNQGLSGFLKKLELRHFDPLRVVFFPYANYMISRDIQKPFSAEEAVQFTYKKYGGFIRPAQFVEEITGLAKAVELLKPRTVLEIGTSTGGTFFMWSRLATQDALLISIDLPGGESDWAYPHWKEPFYKKFASKNQTIELIRGDSHSSEIVGRLKKILGDRQVDVLFIDGDHSYEGVKKDYELYAPFVRTGGVIAFHDIVKFPDYTNVKVKEFWDEVKADKKYKEFIKEPPGVWGGIGALYV